MKTQAPYSADQVEDRGVEAAQRVRKRVVVWLVFAVVLFSALYIAGYLPRAARAKRLQAGAEISQRMVPEVTFALVTTAPAETVLTLPGSIQPVVEAALHARAEGYIRSRLADIGDLVVKGQLLAEIESPELDQQIREAEAAVRRTRAALRQAEANLQQSRVNLRLAEVTAERWSVLVGKGVLSEQDGDEKQTAYSARQAEVGSAEAALQSATEAVTASEAALARMTELQSFRLIRAPFPGVITARSFDIGSLVSPGSSASVRELYRLAQIDRLRVYVNVPQSEMLAIRVGMECEIHVDELRDRHFVGKVTRTASSLDSTSRTLLTEVQVPNPGGLLLPGMYANARLVLQRRDPPLLIPASALRITPDGPRVALLDESEMVRFQPIRLGRDYGAQIEVLAGLQPGQRIVTNLTDEILEGTVVKAVAPAPLKKGPQGTPPPKASKREK